MRGLSLEDRYRFAMSPCNTRNAAAMTSLLHFATAYAARTPVPLDVPVPDRVPASSEELKRLEETYQVLCSPADPMRWGLAVGWDTTSSTAWCGAQIVVDVSRYSPQTAFVSRKTFSSAHLCDWMHLKWWSQHNGTRLAGT